MKKIILSIIISILIIIAGIFGISMLKKYRPQPKKKASVRTLKTINILNVEKSSSRSFVNAFATAEPAQNTTLVSEVAGTVIEVSDKFKIGGVFKKGESLLKIDSTNYKLALSDANSKLKDAQLLYEQELARSSKARRDWKDVGRGKQASSLTLRIPHLESAKAKVELSKVAIEKAQKDLEKTIIVAPYDCRINRIQTNLGAYIAPGVPMALINSLNDIEIKIPLSQDDLAKIGISANFSKHDNEINNINKNLEVVLTSKNKSWQGQILWTSGSFDAVTRITYAITKVENSKGLAPGTPLKVKILGEKVNNIFKIPTKSIYSLDEIIIVKPKNDGSNIAQLYLQKFKGFTLGDEIIVKEGLKEGDIICVSPLNYVVNGMKVKIAK